MSPLNETQKSTLPLLALCAVAAPFVTPAVLISGLGMTAYYCATSRKDNKEDNK